MFYISIAMSAGGEKPDIHEAAKTLSEDVEQYMQLQTKELSDTFELVFQLNQAAVGRYGELVQEAANLREKAKALQEQEIGVASFLSNLTVIEGDISRLEETITKLEKYCTELEEKVGRAQ